MLDLSNYTVIEGDDENFLSYDDKFLITINGVDLSDYVTDFSYTEYDVTTGDSGLDDTAYMQSDYVALDKRRLDIKWSNCPSSYKKKIKSALKNPKFTAVWVTGDDKESVEVESYRGDRKYSMKRNEKNVIRWEISVAIIGLGGDTNVQSE